MYFFILEHKCAECAHSWIFKYIYFLLILFKIQHHELNIKMHAKHIFPLPNYKFDVPITGSVTIWLSTKSPDAHLLFEQSGSQFLIRYRVFIFGVCNSYNKTFLMMSYSDLDLIFALLQMYKLKTSLSQEAQLLCRLRSIAAHTKM